MMGQSEDYDRDDESDNVSVNSNQGSLPVEMQIPETPRFGDSFFFFYYESSTAGGESRLW